MNHYPRKSYRPLQAISVARTIKTPQPEFEDFLERVGREIGRRNVVSEARMTFLESKGVRRAMRSARQTDFNDAKHFSYWLSNQLDLYRTQPIEVSVDPSSPLTLLGRNKNRIALNILPSEDIVDERKRAEECIVEAYGMLPKMKKFEPHITIGTVCLGNCSPEEISDPRLLLPDVEVPGTIALNGLAVFVDGRALKH